MAIRILPVVGNAPQGPDPRAEKKRLLAEQAEGRRIEVRDAIAANDVLRMAALWLDRCQHLSSDRCEESVRDMNILTPELAHAAHERNLPFNAMLRVRTLSPLKGIYSSGPVLQSLAAATIQVENLQFNLEAQERAAKARLQTLAAPGTPPDLGTTDQATTTASGAARTSRAPSLVADAPAGSEQAESTSPTIDNDERIVTLLDISLETGIVYSTLASRRQRMTVDKRPAAKGRNAENRETYRRGDWNQIVTSICARRK